MVVDFMGRDDFEWLRTKTEDGLEIGDLVAERHTTRQLCPVPGNVEDLRAVQLRDGALANHRAIRAGKARELRILLYVAGNATRSWALYASSWHGTPSVAVTADAPALFTTEAFTKT